MKLTDIRDSLNKILGVSSRVNKSGYPMIIVNIADLSVELINGGLPNESYLFKDGSWHWNFKSDKSIDIDEGDSFNIVDELSRFILKSCEVMIYKFYNLEMYDKADDLVDYSNLYLDELNKVGICTISRMEFNIRFKSKYTKLNKTLMYNCYV